MAEQYWGIDLGGTKIEGVVLGATDAPDPLCRIRVPTEADRGYRHVFGRIAELVRAMEAEVGTAPARLGIGTPGVLDPKNSTMKNSNTTCLIGQPLQRDLEAELGVPVALANDANCFALAEARLGAGRGAATAFGVILGTGSAAALSSGNARSTGARASPASGATICSSPRDPNAIAGAAVASRPSSPAPSSSASTPSAVASADRCPKSPRAAPTTLTPPRPWSA